MFHPRPRRIPWLLAFLAPLVATGLAPAGPATFEIVTPRVPDASSVQLAGISSDGRTIAGSFTDPAGVRRSFRRSRGDTQDAVAPIDFASSAISGDGRQVFGLRLTGASPNFSGSAIRWTLPASVEVLAGPSPRSLLAVSASSHTGSVVAIYAIDFPLIGQNTRSFRIATFGLPITPLQPERDWTVWSISSDGQVLVGQSGPTTRFGGDPRFYRPYLRNLAGTLFLDLKAPNGADAQGEAVAVSPDGTVVVGRLAPGFDPRRAFVWDAQRRTRYLPGLDNDGLDAAPRAVVGRLIVGDDLAVGAAVAWIDEIPRRLSSLLRDQGAPIPPGVELTSAFRLSADARAVIGEARIADGSAAAFLATFATPCPADLDDGSGLGFPDDAVALDDLLFFLHAFEIGDLRADLDDNGDPATPSPDHAVTIDDLVYFLAHFAVGC